MAKVEAMNFSMLQAKGISSAASNSIASSKGSTGQFDQIFSSAAGASQNRSTPGNQASASKKEFPVQGKGFSKQDDYVADVSDKMQGSVDKPTDLRAVEDEMKQLVKDVLGIDDAELEEMMASLGLVITDLLNPNILQQFVLQVAGGEGNVDFLTNEALLQNYNELFQELTDFMGENADEVMLLMEALETPVPFEEALQTTIVEEMAVSQESLENAASTTEGTQTANVQTADQPVAEEQAGTVSDMVESVSVQKADDSMEQGFSGESEGEQLSEETAGEDATTLLYADRSKSRSATEVNNPIFADQMNVVQGNIEQVVDVNVNGLHRMQQMVEIVKQVSEQIHNTVDASATTMEMQLNPESLGKVLLTVSAKEGVMTANFKVQSEDARQALESQMYQLREALEAKNLKVESVDVQISNFNFSQSNEAESQMEKDTGKQGKKKFIPDAAEEEEDVTVSEETPEQTRRRVMLESGGSIDYTA